MSEASYAEIIIHSTYYELVRLLIEESGNSVEFRNDSNLFRFFSHRAPGGSIPWLESLLKRNFIPFDNAWNKTAYHGAGRKHVRVRYFNEGRLRRLETKEYFCCVGEGEEFNDDSCSDTSDTKPLLPLIEDVRLAPEHKDLLQDLSHSRTQDWAYCLSNRDAA